MKGIWLTQGRVTIVDDDDYDFLMQWKWQISAHGYARRTQDLGRGGDGRRIQMGVQMHRVIMNAPDGLVVDHINGNPLDNRKENLRICTMEENAYNRKRPKQNTSGFVGVEIRKQKYKGNQKYQYIKARIRHDGKTINLGTFQTIEEASKAYNEASIKYRGEFART